MSENTTNFPSEGAGQHPDFAARTPVPGGDAGVPRPAPSASTPDTPTWTPAGSAWQQPSTSAGQPPAGESWSGQAAVPRAGEGWADRAAQPQPAAAWPGLTATLPGPGQTGTLPVGGGLPGQGGGWPGQAGGVPAGAPSMAWRKVAVAAVAGLAIALTAGGVGGFVGYALHSDGSPLQSVINSGHDSAPVVDRSSLAKIAAEIQPTVVVIETGTGEGSGVIVSADGYIVTNNHVVSGARGSTVRVTFNSGKQVQASIVGTDPRTDLAVVKASATGLKYATWGDSGSVQVGDTVLAIGSPLGLQGSVTAGIVSALHRTITVGDSQQSQFDTGSARTVIGDAIQTDAPINPGNSGGALVDTNGHVIGINSAIATSGSTGNIGVGFAISANKAKAVADQLIKGGKVSHPFLGVSVQNAESGGAQIESIQSDSPAAKAGLQVGDIVTKIDDRIIGGREDLVGAVQSGSVGSQVKITVLRGGAEQIITVTLGEGS